MFPREVLGTIDMLGKALSDEGHRWTSGEQLGYQQLVGWLLGADTWDQVIESLPTGPGSYIEYVCEGLDEDEVDHQHSRRYWVVGRGLPRLGWLRLSEARDAALKAVKEGTCAITDVKIAEVQTTMDITVVETYTRLEDDQDE